MGKIEFLNSLVILFFQHQIQIKMFHFQTTAYGGHKAVDSYLEKFNDNFDRFMEAGQGAFGKLTLSNVNLTACVWNDDNISKNLDGFIGILNSLTEVLSENTDLLTVRDEMLADVNQLKYLLTFS
ncbi:hypothetical protein Klosneuvirus_4_50 [Klosneuvirus KNV1]|uniref:Uncharacterized protein n=1 Tax=Klosneuvirus KNV1 TaxID=1977640 RepID=A0A1V0SKG3_9VIRU|nr:hypothetical protein Klosneuvirus_4_50 [Klosneuvirus KNV1]